MYLPRCIPNVFCFAVLSKSLPSTTIYLVLVLCPRRLHSAAHLCSCASTALQHTFSTVFHPGCGLAFLQITSLHTSGLSCERASSLDRDSVSPHCSSLSFFLLSNGSIHKHRRFSRAS